MEPLTWAFIGTLIGTIIGASTSIFTTYINVRSSARIQEKINKYTRDENFREFQRNNYLELQDTIHKSIRYVSLINLEDLKNYKKTGKWQNSFLLNPENDINSMISIRDLSFKTERVENESLRNKLKKLIEKLKKVNNTSSELESKIILFELASNDINEIMEEIGIELRKTFKN